MEVPLGLIKANAASAQPTSTAVKKDEKENEK